MSALMQELQLAIFYYQNPEKVHLIFLNELILTLLQLYQVQELEQKMDFQTQEGPKTTDWKLMKI